MILLSLFKFTFITLIVFGIVTQIIFPLMRGLLLFPAFRSKTNAIISDRAILMDKIRARELEEKVRELEITFELYDDQIANDKE